MSRLNLSRIGQLSADVQVPHYDPQQLAIGVVHLGIGAFHRAHQAVYFDDLQHKTGDGMGILGVSLRSTEIRDQLEPQHGLYSVMTLNDTEKSLRVIGSVRGVLHAPSQSDYVLQSMTASNVKIWSLTVTEKGYCHLPATGELNFEHPDIQFDLQHPAKPRSAIGYLVSALEKRYQMQQAPIILCCDNLPHNGQLLRGLVLSFARSRNAALSTWIEQEVAFPSTMVDRIVPAALPADIDTVTKLLGCQDLGLVKAEPFSQWVIEHDANSTLPRLDEVGAMFVKSVTPFEHIKLRLLNGSHSSLAYWGQLCGHEFVADTMNDRALRVLVKHLMEVEVSPSLEIPAGFDLPNYREQLLQRFANRALAHRTQQIAMDGSQKLPQRLLGSLRDQLDAGGEIEVLTLAIAAWLRYVKGVDARGNAYKVDDPHASELQSRIHSANSIAEQIPSLLAFAPVFGEDLRHNKRFTTLLQAHLESLYRDGASITCQRIAQKISV
jgi:fructuronate reductase